MNATGPRFASEALVAWTEQLLVHVGVARGHAQSCARILGSADLRGIDSHGVARLPAYVAMIERGAVAVDAEPRVDRRDGATALVDAGNVLGHPASELAMNVAIELAGELGTGWVLARNSNHYGIAGHYAAMAAEKGFVGMTGTNAGARVAPAGAREPFFGTNPLAMAAPTDRPPIFLLDMATSAVSTGKFEIAAREGRAIPEGLGVDSDGVATRDPNQLAAGGWLLPLGSFPELSDHKGSGLALMVEVLSALLAGGLYGPNVQNLLFADSDKPPGVSHYFCAIDPARFGDPTVFTARVTAMLEALRELPPTDPERPVMTPGEPEWREEGRRREHGVPLIAPVVEALTVLGDRVGVGFVEAGKGFGRSASDAGTSDG